MSDNQPISLFKKMNYGMFAEKCTLNHDPVTLNGKAMGNAYSHNCMMHRDTILKYGRLFVLVKDMQQT